MRGRTLKEHINEKMGQPEFKRAWVELDSEFSILEGIIKARKKAGLTQENLAKRIGTKQPALSRLEKGGFETANIETLRKIADALNLKLIARLEPKSAHGAV